METINGVDNVKAYRSGYRFSDDLHRADRLRDPASVGEVAAEVKQWPQAARESFVQGFSGSQRSYYSEEVERFPSGPAGVQHNREVGVMVSALRAELGVSEIAKNEKVMQAQQEVGVGW